MTPAAMDGHESEGDLRRRPNDSSEQPNDTSDDQLMRSILAGSFDMHVHGSPDVVPRKMSDVQLAKAARDAGLQGIVLKCHYGSTVGCAAVVAECVPGIQVFGGLVLNQMVGGLNARAVETAVRLGGKEIWLPTINAENHVTKRGGNPSTIVPVTDRSGDPLPELVEILKIIAQHNVVLATGHISPAESCTVVPLAKNLGVKKIVITHPEWEIVDMSVDTQKSLRGDGVFFEHCYYNIVSDSAFNIDTLTQQIRMTGVASNILDTDLGQPDNDDPVKGFQQFISLMYHHGFTAKEIETMIKDTPSLLLDTSA